jgi:2-methylcitrate dehydratase PrpD
MNEAARIEPTRDLSRFVAGLSYEALPRAVVAKAKELMVDWLGSALAGRVHPAVDAFENFNRIMGPATGPSTILVSGRKTSPYFAALINGASSHVVEQDDVHNGSVFHPAAVVFPAVLAVAEELGSSGRAIIEASVVGYEVGIRVGEALGRSHYEIFHTTGTAGTLAAAAAVAKLLDLDEAAVNHALGTAGTQASGLWEFLRDAADSKQVHTAKAAADGLLSAYLARDGVRGAKAILEGRRGMAAGMSRDAVPERAADRLGERWALLETSYKWHASCRHTHPAADALQEVMRRENLQASDILEITAHVHRGAIDVLGAVSHPVTIHQSKFCMGSVLGLIAVRGRADLASFDEAALQDTEVASFLDRVHMEFDPEVDAAYPRKWIGKVTVVTRDGRTVHGRVDDPKGDPENPLTAEEVEAKALRLAQYGGSVPGDTVRSWISRIGQLEAENSFSGFFRQGA